MLAGVRQGGAVVVHVLNVWALPDGPCVWQKNVQVELQGRRFLVVKGVHRCGGRAYVDLLVQPLEGEGQRRAESVPFVGLRAEDLGQHARDHGAATVAFFGGYGGQPYDPDKSTDLIMVGRAVAFRQPGLGHGHSVSRDPGVPSMVVGWECL